VNPLIDKTIGLIEDYKRITGLNPTKIVVGTKVKETFNYLDMRTFNYVHVGEKRLELPIILVDKLDNNDMFIRRQ